MVKLLLWLILLVLCWPAMVCITAARQTDTTPLSSNRDISNTMRVEPNSMPPEPDGALLAKGPLQLLALALRASRESLVLVKNEDRLLPLGKNIRSLLVVGPNGTSTQANGVLYPFGHGLSYTTFQYDNLQVSPRAQKPQGTIRVSVDVTNAGTRAGDEVVQLYLRDQLSSVITYDQVLRGFQRITLAPGEKRTVTFTLGPEDLQLLDERTGWVVEPGSFEVQVGSSSSDVRVRDRFEIVR